MRFLINEKTSTAKQISNTAIVTGTPIIWTGAAAPTADEIAAAITGASLVAAQAAKIASLGAALKSALLAEFNSLTPAQQYMLNGARLALNDDLSAGNMTNAIAGVTSYILPDPSLAAAQSTVLGILNTYAPKFAAVAAAATVDAVNAIA